MLYLGREASLNIDFVTYITPIVPRLLLLPLSSFFFSFLLSIRYLLVSLCLFRSRELLKAVASHSLGHTSRIEWFGLGQRAADVSLDLIDGVINA